MGTRRFVPVLVAPGRCVIWQCTESPVEGEVACAGHVEGLNLPQAPCKHGTVGRCKLCWESMQPEVRRRRNREGYARLMQDPQRLAKYRQRRREYMRKRYGLNTGEQLATPEG